MFKMILSQDELKLMMTMPSILINTVPYLDSSLLALLSATSTAWVLLLTPTVAEPCFTASMAYSTCPGSNVGPILYIHSQS